MDSQTSDGRAIFFEMTSLMGGVRAENCTENQNSELTVAEERNDALDRQYETVMHHTMFNKSERFEWNFRPCGLKIFSVALRRKPRVKQPSMKNIPRSFCASLLNYAISSFCVLVCVVMWKPGCYYTHKKKKKSSCTSIKQALIKSSRRADPPIFSSLRIASMAAPH